jgi:hypothetical protein
LLSPSQKLSNKVRIFLIETRLDDKHKGQKLMVLNNISGIKNGKIIDICDLNFSESSRYKDIKFTFSKRRKQAELNVLDYSKKEIIWKQNLWKYNEEYFKIY